MRGIRIWHLAALALSVPLLAAAVPAGCMGGLNPNFRNAIGQDAGSAVPIPTGYLMIGIFNETGWPGYIDVTVNGKTWFSAWRFGFDAVSPRGLGWACELSSVDIQGGQLDVPDATGAVQQQGISYNGGVLSGNKMSDPLECGTLLKLMIVAVANTGGTLDYHCFVDILK